MELADHPDTIDLLLAETDQFLEGESVRDEPGLERGERERERTREQTEPSAGLQLTVIQLSEDQDLSPQDLSPQDLSPQDLPPQDLSPQDLSPLQPLAPPVTPVSAPVMPSPPSTADRGEGRRAERELSPEEEVQLSQEEQQQISDPCPGVVPGSDLQVGERGPESTDSEKESESTGGAELQRREEGSKEVSSVMQTTATEKELLLQEKDQLQREQQDRIWNLTYLLVSSSSDLAPTRPAPKRRVTWGGHSLTEASSKKRKANASCIELDEEFYPHGEILDEAPEDMDSSHATTRSFGDSTKDVPPEHLNEVCAKMSSLEQQLETERHEAQAKVKALDDKVKELELQLQHELQLKQDTCHRLSVAQEREKELEMEIRAQRKQKMHLTQVILKQKKYNTEEYLEFIKRVRCYRHYLRGSSCVVLGDFLNIPNKPLDS